MKIPKILLAIGLAVILSSCRLEVKVDEGGAVVNDARTLVSPMSGTVSAGDTINCDAGGGDCDEDYLQTLPANRTETLIATPDSGYAFEGWYGDCNTADVLKDASVCTCNSGNTTASCVVTMSGDWSPIHIEARFRPTDIALDSIADHSFAVNFATDTSITATLSTGTASSYSIISSDTDIVTASINSSGVVTLNPANSTAVGHSEITVEAHNASSKTARTRFMAVVGVAHPVFACGTGIETNVNEDFVNFESSQTRPMAFSPNGKLLFVANTPANCLEIYSVAENSSSLTMVSSVRVGLEPIAVAANTDTQVWVVNHLSDSVSIVDFAVEPHVTQTLLVGDEPRDIVFAEPSGGARRAYISAAYRGQNHPEFSPADLQTPGLGRADVWVFDATHPILPSTDEHYRMGGTPVDIVRLFSDSPRALAVSPDNTKVYAAAFLSGNQTTTVGFRYAWQQKDSLTPGGNPGKPPVKDGDSNPVDVKFHVDTDDDSIPDAWFKEPHTGLIVKKNLSNSHWEDEAATDWSAAVNFDLPDYDLFVIDTTSDPEAEGGLDVTNVAHLGTVLFNLAVDNSDNVYVSNLESLNQKRFVGAGAGSSCVTNAINQDPSGDGSNAGAVGTTIRGHFVDNRITVVPSSLSPSGIKRVDLNSHVEYNLPMGGCGAGTGGSFSSAQEAASADDKAKSLALPNAMAIDNTHSKLYVAAFGSAKIGVFDTSELLAGSVDPDTDSANYINLADHNESATPAELTGGSGPAGLLLNGDASRLFVYTRFDHKVRIINTSTKATVFTQSLYSPEPEAIKTGRPFLYDANFSSANGTASCGSCHISGDFDGLAWDLGNPNGSMGQYTMGDVSATGNRIHPLKGPMVTQTFRGMFDHGPMHWRADQQGTNKTDSDSAFNAFNGDNDESNKYNGGDGPFVALLGREEQISAVNMGAFRAFAKSINEPPNPIRRLQNGLEPGSQSNGLGLYGTAETSNCNSCHRVAESTVDPTSATDPLMFGTNRDVQDVAVIEQRFKVPQARNLYTKVGMFGGSSSEYREFQLRNNSGVIPNLGNQIRGFGFMHDGSWDTLEDQMRVAATDCADETSGPNDCEVPNLHTSGALAGEIITNGLEAEDPANGVDDNGAFDNFLGGSNDTGDGATNRTDVAAFQFTIDSKFSPMVGQQITIESQDFSKDYSALDIDSPLDGLINDWDWNLVFTGVTQNSAPVIRVIEMAMYGNCDLIATGTSNGVARIGIWEPTENYLRLDTGDTMTAEEILSWGLMEGKDVTFTCYPIGVGRPLVPVVP